MTSCHHYRIANRRLTSVVPLPELRRADGPPDLTFEIGHCPDFAGRAVRRYSWSNATYLTIIRSDVGWAFDFPGTAAFLVENSGRIVCEPEPDAAAAFAQERLQGARE